MEVNPNGHPMITQSREAMPYNRTVEMGIEIALEQLCMEERYPVEKAFTFYNPPKRGGL